MTEADARVFEVSRTIVEQRAAVAAAKAGVSREFFMVQMNYRALVSDVYGMISPDGGMCSCGGKVLGEPDICINASPRALCICAAWSPSTRPAPAAAPK